MVETAGLWRPVGRAELNLIAASGWTAFPSRLPEQSIFYPVLNREYAQQIARDWNYKREGAGYVTHFKVRRAFAERYPVQQVGGASILEYWIPATDLPEFNRAIVGPIEVTDWWGAKP